MPAPPSVTERPVQVGRDRHLSGVVTLPATGAATGIGVVLMNAGVIHRVGPHRFNVKLARRLAQRGHAVIRLDLTGLGDSGVPSRGLPYEAQSVADLQAAMDSLSAIAGVKSFVVAGICSGARNAWATALADERVHGAWMMDGFFMPTWKTPVHYWSRRVAYERPWPFAKRFVSRMVRQVGARLKPAPAHILPAPRDVTAVRRRFIEELSRLATRGVRTCFVFSGSNLREYSYEAQLEDVIRGKVPQHGVDVQFMPSVDHTLTTLDGQQRVTAQVEDFCSRLVGTSAADIGARESAPA